MGVETVSPQDVRDMGSGWGEARQSSQQPVEALSGS